MKNRHKRLFEEGREDFRTPAQVDRDRIQYSSAFSRLAEITQVVSAERGYVFHNRLTHSLKVAQLTRRLAEKLGAEQPSIVKAIGGLDPDAAEAVALAHDLGHPPFGHIAEKELDSCARKAGLADGFNGNAQSFRIVTKLAVGDPAHKDQNRIIRGLNLTRATLNGILKYPWLHGKNSKGPHKWGAYETERREFQWARKGNNFSGQTKSPEAELMDWADDITFAVHDVVDFFCAGQIPLDRLADPNDEAQRRGFFDEVFARCSDLAPRKKQLEVVFREVLEYFPINMRYVGNLRQRLDLWQFITILISRYVDAIRFVRPLGSSKTLVKIESYAKDEIRMLKELTWHYVTLNHELATLQYGQRLAVRSVFCTMLAAAEKESSWKLFPVGFQEELRAAKSNSRARKRAVVDFVASLTEREITSLFSRLSHNPS